MYIHTCVECVLNLTTNELYMYLDTYTLIHLHFQMLLIVMKENDDDEDEEEQF